VNALLDGGYVEYVDNPAHRRSKLVAPTERGLSTFEDMRARENAAFEQLRIDATPEALAAATKLLRTLIATFDSPQWQRIVDRHKPDAEG